MGAATRDDEFGDTLDDAPDDILGGAGLGTATEGGIGREDVGSGAGEDVTGEGDGKGAKPIPLDATEGDGNGAGKGGGRGVPADGNEGGIDGGNMGGGPVGEANEAVAPLLEAAAPPPRAKAVSKATTRCCNAYTSAH